MRLAIVGSRTFNDYSKLEKYLNRFLKLNEVEAIISGGCKGADLLGQRYAEERGIPVLIFRPNWKLGRHAGFLRNQEIIDACEVVIAFWDGHSTGTKDSIEKAQAQGKTVVIRHF